MNELIAEYLDDDTLSKMSDENISLRLKLLKTASGSVDFQKTLKIKCKNDFLFWLTHFCYSYDPRPSAVKNIFPFVPYEYQNIDTMEIISQIDKGEDVLIEKSRDMGFTWLIVYIFQWYWQFKESSNFLVGSKKLDNVDVQGDMACIFEKIRFNIRKQPPFLLPENFDPVKHLLFCRCINPENGNAIIGESSNADFGRSGRYKAVLFDEFAFWETDNTAWGASSQSTLCRIALSTPYGKANKFASLRFKSPIKVLTRHWTAHPRKTKNLIKFDDGTFTSDWYLSEKQRMTSAEIARELDIDYLTSREGAVYKFNRKIHVVNNLKEQIFAQSEVKTLYRVWDFGLNPAVVFLVNTPYGVKILREIVPDDRPTTSKLVSLVESFTNKEFPNVPVDDYCDVAGNQENRQTNKTDIEILEENGIFPDSEKTPIEDGIIAVQALLDRPSGFEVDAKCVSIIEAFEGGYFRKEDKTGQNREMPPVEIHPFEDVMDCIRYHIWRHFRPSNFNKKKEVKQKYTYIDTFGV